MHFFQLASKEKLNFDMEKHEKTFNCYDISHTKEAAVRDFFPWW